MVCSNKEAWRCLARRHSRNGPWTHECCFEVDVFVCWDCIQNVECSLEMIYLYVDSGLRNWNDDYTKGLSVFLSWVSRTQPKYWTNLMM